MVKRLAFLAVLATFVVSASGCSFAMGKKGAKVDGAMAAILATSAVVVVATDDSMEHCDHGCYGVPSSIAAVPLGILAIGYAIGGLYGSAQGARETAAAEVATIHDRQTIEIEYQREWESQVARRRRNSRKAPSSGMKGE